MKRSTGALLVVSACITTGVVVACSDRGADQDGPTSKQASAVVQPPQSERDKCHGAPSCDLPGGQKGCRVKGECVAECSEPYVGGDPNYCADNGYAAQFYKDPCNSCSCCLNCNDAGTFCPSGYGYDNHGLLVYFDDGGAEFYCCKGPIDENYQSTCDPPSVYCPLRQ